MISYKNITYTLKISYLGTFIPHKVNLNVEIGKPILVEKKQKELITDADINKLHDKFVVEIQRLFDRTKSKYNEKDKVLEIY